ncbi:MAG: Flp pilus assembly complex ATPase component TadA [Candidatus Nealsonbacteria bacterium]|nr:Flp pilus assembly complex ATPase component TadA [Candidatus Nealsonbacteria bacterium]
MNLIQQLVKKGFLDKDNALRIEKEAKETLKSVEELLLEENIVTEDVLFGIKAEEMKLSLKSAAPEDIPSKILELIPEDSATHYKVVPLAKKDGTVGIGMIHPEDLKAQEALRFWSRQGKFAYKIFLITPSVFQNILKQYRTMRKEVGRALEELETELKEKIGAPALNKEELSRVAEDAPITRVVAVILRHAIEGKASDIHIEPTREELRVRFRQDGILHSSLVLPLKTSSAVAARIKILSNLRIDESRIPQDGRFSARLEGRNIDFRVSTFPTTMGEKVVIRVLDPTEGLKRFEILGLEGRNLKVVEKAVAKPFGLILATGPTGSGKTTTLYAILNSLNVEGVNIMTLEDPVEYFVSGVNQSQIRPEIGYNYATGLRHILRQDPDIIMVGEIRDEESASLSIHAALTGHIVLSTLHTTDSLGVIPRLIDLGIEPFLLPPSLSLAIAQRLVRRLCQECKKEVKPRSEIREIIMKELDSLPPAAKKDYAMPKEIKIFQAQGCKKCQNEGYSGRIAIYEILEMTDYLADMILKDPSESNIAKEAKNQGMITMRQDGILKVLSGVTSIEEVLMTTGEK